MENFLTNSLFHSTKGRYFTDTKVVGIDFITTLLGEGDTASTQTHETGHLFLCNSTEMGMIFVDVENNIHKFKELSHDEQKKIVSLLFNSQQMLQEGYSTFIQFATIRRHMDKKHQEDWLKRLPDNYRRWLDPFLFSFELSMDDREKINILVPHAMNTHIRKDAKKYQLLESSKNLEEYLNNDDNNPSIRIGKLLKTIEKDPKLLSGDLTQIFKISGVKIFEPIEKKDVASFMNYLASRMGLTTNIMEEQVSEAPTVDQIFNHVQDNTMIANLNLNLDQNAMLLSKAQEVIEYSDNIERILAFYNDEKTKLSMKRLQELNPEMFDEEPQVSLIMQTTTGEKYIYPTSIIKAIELINKELSNAILAVKFGDYNLPEDNIYWLPKARPPDLIIFNLYWQMNNFLSEYIKANSNAKFDYCHIGFGAGNINTILVKIHGKTPLLTVNMGVPGQATKIKETIKNYSNEFSKTFIEQYKRQLNSHLILWSGFDHRIDWVNVLSEDMDHDHETE